MSSSLLCLCLKYCTIRRFARFWFFRFCFVFMFCIIVFVIVNMKWILFLFLILYPKAQWEKEISSNENVLFTELGQLWKKNIWFYFYSSSNLVLARFGPKCVYVCAIRKILGVVYSLLLFFFFIYIFLWFFLVRFYFSFFFFIFFVKSIRRSILTIQRKPSY